MRRSSKRKPSPTWSRRRGVTLAALVVVAVAWLISLLWPSFSFAQLPVESSSATAPAETQPATQPEAVPAAAPPAPVPRLIGEYQDRVAAEALVGIWINDTGAQPIRLVFKRDNTFTLGPNRGHYFVIGNQLQLRAGGKTSVYTFDLAPDTLTLSGGDMRKETKFSQQANVADYFHGLLQISPVAWTKRFARLAMIIIFVIVARLIIAAIRAVLTFIVKTEWGPLGLFWRYNKSRALTVQSLILNLIKYVIYFTAIGFILSEFGVNYTAYLASLSVVGLAIGFGSQGLVQDMVTGFFVIFEAQFDVGDMVEISGQVGVVTDLGLRSTRLRNYVGQSVVIPNRFIAVVGNYAGGAQQAVVDIAIPQGVAPDKPAQLARQEAEEIARQFPGVVVAPPVAEPTVELVTGERFVRVRIPIWPQQVWVIDTQFLPRIRDVFKREGIEVPNDRIAVAYHSRAEEQSVNWLSFVKRIRGRFEGEQGSEEA